MVGKRGGREGKEAARSWCHFSLRTRLTQDKVMYDVFLLHIYEPPSSSIPASSFSIPRSPISQTVLSTVK